MNRKSEGFMEWLSKLHVFVLLLLAGACMLFLALGAEENSLFQGMTSLGGVVLWVFGGAGLIFRLLPYQLSPELYWGYGCYGAGGCMMVSSFAQSAFM